MFLNAHTWYSLKYGTISPEQLFELAKEAGIKKLALTEINSTGSYVELLRICQEKKQEHELDLALGIEIRQNNDLLYVLLGENNEGFEELNRFFSFHRNHGKDFPERPKVFDHVFCIYPYGTIDAGDLKPREWIGVAIKNLNKFILDKKYKAHPERYVILQPITFSNEAEFALHRILRAVDNNILISQLQPSQHGDKTEHVFSEIQLEEKFKMFPGLIQNTRDLLAACSIVFELGTDKNKQTFSGSLENDWTILVTNAWEGFQKHYDASDPVLRERFERELNVIEKKKFCSYYLLAYDIIKFADEHNIDHVGRGSGANSVVAYCLGITGVDPIELNLYFERFLNEERTSPPDFDLDFSWTQRDRIYEYIFSKHTKQHACLLGAYATFQFNSIIRELGKVFGLPKAEIDQIAEHPEGINKSDRIIRQIFKFATQLKEMPSHLSIHAGGVLITEKPIYYYTATTLPPKNLPVCFLDMYSAEDIGLYKLDILSQRGLGHIRDCAELIHKLRGVRVDTSRFNDFKRDEKIRDLLREGRAMGCFYIESPSMRTLIKKLRCEDYLTLVAASSIIRPGVSSSGMMSTYIERYHIVRNGGTYESIHPMMDELMADTYGVMVYQEDVIKVAHHLAGLTLTEADVLRRAMSGKFRSRKAFDQVREKFFHNLKESGFSQKVADRIWFEIESFSGYSFAKGHSASYAVESYQSLYLKAHYPQEFMVSVINNFGGFYKTEFYFQEARMLGGKVEAPCINTSEYKTTIADGKIFVGFIHIKSLESKLGELIEKERRQNGPFRNLHHFMTRIPTQLEQICILIRSGAFRFSGKSKQVLQWEAMLFMSNAKIKRPVGLGLFDEQEVQGGNFELPSLQAPEKQDAFDEIELLGFPLCDPFELLSSSDRGDTCAKDLLSKEGKSITIVGYLVTIKYTTTKTKKELMFFGTFNDSQGIVFDTVHFPKVARLYPFQGAGFYKIEGIAKNDFGVPIIEVRVMHKMPIMSPSV